MRSERKKAERSAEGLNQRNIDKRSDGKSKKNLWKGKALSPHPRQILPGETYEIDNCEREGERLEIQSETAEWSLAKKRTQSETLSTPAARRQTSIKPLQQKQKKRPGTFKTEKKTHFENEADLWLTKVSSRGSMSTPNAASIAGNCWTKSREQRKGGG